MNVAVIGSGPAGTACAKALVRAGLVPTIIDVGERLSAERQAAVDRMAAVGPTLWNKADRELVTANPTLLRAGVPKKIVFGSDYHFGHDRSFSPTDAEEGLPSATYALGGYTVAWGAAVLPTHDSDLQDWPIRRKNLEASYQRILADMPLSGAQDSLSAAFPLYKENLGALPRSQDIGSFLSDLEPLTQESGPSPFLSGQARLAINSALCRSCGLCLSGCVYGAIHSTEHDIKRLSLAGRLRYRDGWVVLKLQEEGARVAVEMRHTASHEVHEESFDRVFLAAGAIQSTRIVLHSLQLYDSTVMLKDSQKFILPLVRLKRSRLAWPNSVALAGAFLDFKVPAISDHWVHAQVSAVNDYVLQRFKITPGQGSFKARLLAPFFERLLVAWCGLHSDHSSSIALTLSSDLRNDLPILKLRARINPATTKLVRRIAHHLAINLARARTFAVSPALMLGAPGGGNHFGGSLPMRSRPRDRLDTDSLGRPHAWRRIHVVDGAVLPSIPATTIALLQMANADRIATAVAEGNA